MQMFIVVQSRLVYDLTGSALQLGLLGLARAIPATGLVLAGGVVADNVDQRRLLMATTAGGATVYLVLATLTLAGWVHVWHVLAAVFLVGAFQAFDQPTRQAIFPHLIDRRDMMSAVALKGVPDQLCPQASLAQLFHQPAGRGNAVSVHQRVVLELPTACPAVASTSRVSRTIRVPASSRADATWSPIEGRYPELPDRPSPPGCLGLSTPSVPQL